MNTILCLNTISLHFSMPKATFIHLIFKKNGNVHNIILRVEELRNPVHLGLVNNNITSRRMTKKTREEGKKLSLPTLWIHQVGDKCPFSHAGKKSKKMNTENELIHSFSSQMNCFEF